MPKCYDCTAELDPCNRSLEHIFHNSIGGRWKTYDLLCKFCNSTFGSCSDSALAEALNPLANMLNIARDRGSPQDIDAVDSVDGTPYKLSSGMKPQMAKPIIDIYIKETNGRKEIRIVARNEKEAKQFLDSLKKKHPERAGEIGNLRSEMTSRQEKLTNPLNISLSLGGNYFFRAATKSAVNFFIARGGDRSAIVHLLPFLKGRVDEDIAWHYYPSKQVFDLKENQVSHTITLVGDPNERVLYAVISYFSTYCLLINLNSNYDGPEHEESYSYDVLLNCEVDTKILYKPNKDQIDEWITAKEMPYDRFTAAFQRFGRIAMGRQYWDAKAEELTRKGFEKLKEHDLETLTPEQISRIFAHEVATGLLPNIVAATKKRHREEHIDANDDEDE